MNYTSQQSTSQPHASIVNIHQNKYRLYGNTIYMNDGEEFKIHLYNPTNDIYLAKIQLNGNFISNSGLIVRPGESVFLERYLDDNKKFKFSVYKIEDKPEHSHILENNGLLEIFWYKEWVNYNYTGTTTTTSTWGTGYHIYNDNCTSTPCLGIPYTYTSNNSTPITNVKTINYSNTIKTGRVQKGSNSDQKFSYEDIDFQLISTYVDRYKLLPKEYIPVEVKRQTVAYCPECGYRKRKSSWKYCPRCGEKL